MSTKRQIVLSVALVTVALIVVLVIAGGGDESAPSGKNAHEQMAPAGGDGRRTVRLDDESARRIGVTYAVAERKPFLLRIDREILDAVQRWADDDLRSLNGQIEFLLRRALKEGGREPRDAKKEKKEKS